MNDKDNTSEYSKNLQKKKGQINNSDLHTAHTNNSYITGQVVKKMSLFDEDIDMLQSIVAGEEQPKKSLYNTSDLMKLRKLGKYIG